MNKFEYMCHSMTAVLIVIHDVNAAACVPSPRTSSIQAEL